jgi:hypothetical protein
MHCSHYFEPIGKDDSNSNLQTHSWIHQQIENNSFTTLLKTHEELKFVWNATIS